MAKKVSDPSKIKLKTSNTAIRSTKPRSDKASHNDQDSSWKKGLAGTSLEDYRLDLMKLD